ncbi:MAG: GIY-YIG nuclease family protein [Nitrospira sp. SB0677_bin_15]|nr:GIY-YIG nuclease family protein [Nitrospira sp. SB0677_bin_15]MYH02596.1 GIY-YIG nuclease family protein [Nitrospira sp. SB0675_bin_23]
MKTQIEIVNITWEGPLSPDGVEKHTSSGVYQYYGDHHVYGSDVLLYIGQATNLAERISGHRFDKWCDRNIQIYFGPVEQDMLDRVEKLLICASAPARNGQHVKEPLDETLDESLLNLLILNWGAYRGLLPEVSGYRFTDHLYKL